MKEKDKKITVNVESRDINLEILLSDDPQKPLSINTNGFISFGLL